MGQTTVSKMEKIMPYLDNLMLTELKINQIKKRGQIVPKELDDLCLSQKDALTEQWINVNQDILRSLNINP